MEFVGFVIRSTPFRDHDAMVTVLSNDKLHSFLARGALKYESKLGHTINIYSKSRFQITRGKEGYILRNAELIDSFENSKSDILRLAVLDFIGELTNKMIQSEDAKNVYPFLERSLELINSGFSPLTVAIIYFAKVLDVTGYSINVDSCQICGKKDHIVAVSYEDGGFICQDCFSPLNHTKSNPMELKMIRFIFKVDVDSMNRVEFEKDNCLKILKNLDNFLDHVCQCKLKSIELLTKI